MFIHAKLWKLIIVQITQYECSAHIVCFGVYFVFFYSLQSKNKKEVLICVRQAIRQVTS